MINRRTSSAGKKVEIFHTLKHIENPLELRTIFIHHRFWDCANGGCSLYYTPQRTF